MRRPSRQVNVFSVSALDLFASAMGAFIILAVILFPYYLKLQDAPTKEELKSTAEQLAQVESQIKNNEREIAKAEAELDSLKPKDIEVVFVLDTTGSMEEEINSIKEHLRDVVNTLRLVNKKTRMGFVAYRDVFEDAGRINSYITRTHPLRDMTRGNLEQLIKFVDSLDAGGGGFTPAESLSLGLEKAMAMDWKSGNTKHIIVAITDAPAKEKDRAKQLARQFSSSRKNTASSKVSTILAADRDTRRAGPFLKELAQSGKGEYINDRGRMLSSLLKATLAP